MIKVFYGIKQIKKVAASLSRLLSDVHLLMPKDKFKDQTFFLSGIKRNSLRQTMFPLSEFLKSDVKIMAKKCGFERLTQKKESTGICFVGNRDFKDFIKEVKILRYVTEIDFDKSFAFIHLNIRLLISYSNNIVSKQK